MPPPSALVKFLQSEAEIAKSRSIQAIFDSDSKRIENFTVVKESLKVDYSKQNLSSKGWDALLEYCEKANIGKKINALFSGKNINVTEDKPALHFALRAPKESSLNYKSRDVVKDVHKQLDLMSSIVNKIRTQKWRGYSGKIIKDVVSLGVGGSELGPLLVCNALQELDENSQGSLNLHFVSSMDGTQISKLLEILNPETTIFIISSKSFTTVDTFYNANTALNWITSFCSDERVAKKQHFIGVSASTKKMDNWGIPKENQLLMWDWVGGRFSLWSAIGLPIAIKYGMDVFYELLEGAYDMDQHFQSSPFNNNIPVVLALISFWNASFMEIGTNAVLPYDGRLKLLPNFLSQLEMESNGKAVTIYGQKVDFKTSPIIWGDLGPNAQHAFYQLLHQGTQCVSCDFITTVKRYYNGSNGTTDSLKLQQQQDLSLANCFAQSSVLAFGSQSAGEGKDSPHKEYRGNQPSTTILIEELTPRVLGNLLALYEHKTYILSCLWEINPFDQWGVELGKSIAQEALLSIQSNSGFDNYDSSTQWLLEQASEWRVDE